jgi:uncharacterized protein YoxC
MEMIFRMITDKLQDLINTANSGINALLTRYANSTDPSETKKAQLLAYWISDYCRFIKREETFNPAKLKKYKRGDILQVHLGFNIGSEEGGLHYVVVISTNNPSISDTLTVLPLTSKKSTYKPNPYSIDLGDTIYSQLVNKYDAAQRDVSAQISSLSAVLTDLRKEQNKLIHDINEKGATSESMDLITNELSNCFSRVQETITELTELQSEYSTIQKIQTEISHMKSGSIALVGQITTISKIRIYNPLRKSDSLHGIRLAPEYMDKIDAKVKDLYTHK